MRYSNVRDYTMQQRGPSPGTVYRRSCLVCGQHRAILGGSIFGKLRLWRCAECARRAKEKSDAA